MGTLSPRQIRWLFALTLAVGAAARIAAWRWGPPIYADAYFQYLEPAWIRISGAGIQTWEWLEGIRSWVLPGYHGAWMALFASLGWRGHQIGAVLQLHWALLSLTMVWAAWRAGASMARQAPGFVAIQRERALLITPSVAAPGWQAGFIAAWLVATFPLLALYSVETLSELPSMISAVLGLALAVEIMESKPDQLQAAQLAVSASKLATMGGFLALAVCLRLANAAIAAIPVVWLLVRRQWRDVRWVMLGAAIPIAFFGLVDRLTWGGYFSSFVAYLKFNLVDGRAAQIFGRAPGSWYLTKFVSRLPFALWPALILGLFALRVTWPWLGSAALLLSLVSAQPHKEERFAIVLWPLLLIAAGAGAGNWLVTKNTAVNQRFDRRSLLALLGCLLVAADGYWHLKRSEFSMTRDRYRAQVWVREQPGTTGLLVDWCFYTAGYLWFDSTLPMVQYKDPLLNNRLFSHVLAPHDARAALQARRRGFVQVFQLGDIVVLSRPQAPIE